MYCALEFWFSPLQSDEPSTGSERDALKDESTADPELGPGHAAEMQNTKNMHSLTAGIYTEIPKRLNAVLAAAQGVVPAFEIWE